MRWVMWCGGAGTTLLLLSGCAPRGEARAAAARQLDCAVEAVQLEAKMHDDDGRTYVAECREFHQPPPVIVSCRGNRCEDVRPCVECLEERRRELGLPVPKQHVKRDEARLSGSTGLSQE